MISYAVVRGVTFDVGGTLITPWPSVGHIYSDIARRYGYGEISPVALNRQFVAAWNKKQGFSHARHQWRALVNETFSGLVAAEPSEPFFSDLYHYFATAGAWRVFADVHPVLNELRAGGFKLAVVSNWDERLRPLLSELGLGGYFDAFAISMEVGATKPAKEIFDRAATDLCLPANALLHVGDAMTEDYQGATAVGMSALLLDRGASSSGHSVIRSLTELPGLLQLR
jgi:putative hydrolase of the HAD superfamily